jgi:hypothetical protein
MKNVNSRYWPCKTEQSERCSLNICFQTAILRDETGRMQLIKYCLNLKTMTVLRATKNDERGKKRMNDGLKILVSEQVHVPGEQGKYEVAFRRWLVRELEAGRNGW